LKTRSRAYKKIWRKSDDDQAHYNLGRFLQQIKQRPEALKSLQQAVKLNPTTARYQTELGVILI
jgi:tetratricopeptide (TPR) repeat protein